MNSEVRFSWHRTGVLEPPLHVQVWAKENLTPGEYIAQYMLPQGRWLLRRIELGPLIEGPIAQTFRELA